MEISAPGKRTLPSPQPRLPSPGIIGSPASTPVRMYNLTWDNTSIQYHQRRLSYSAALKHNFSAMTIIFAEHQADFLSTVLSMSTLPLSQASPPMRTCLVCYLGTDISPLSTIHSFTRCNPRSVHLTPG